LESKASDLNATARHFCFEEKLQSKRQKKREWQTTAVVQGDGDEHLLGRKLVAGEQVGDQCDQHDNAAIG
jgi:hypothetical protein